MKKIFLLALVSLFAVALAAQTTVYEGEKDVNPWDNIGEWANVEVVDWGQENYYYATLWRDNGQEPWSGGALWEINADLSAYNKISMDVRKIVEGDVQIELQADGIDNAHLKVWYVPSNGTTPTWQTITFDIPESHRRVIKNLLVAPHAVETRDWEDGATPMPENADGVEYTRMDWNNIIAHYEKEDVGSSVARNKSDARVISTEVFTLTGSYLGKGLELNTLAKGVYILKNLHEDGITTSSKVAVQ